MKSVLVIGLGSIGKRHLANFKKLKPNIETIGVSSSGSLGNRVIEFADTLVDSLQQGIDLAPDMAIVASPASHHAKHLEKLLDAGIPTIIEKPIVANNSDAEFIEGILRKSKTPVTVGYCLRYMSAARKVKELIEKNVLGAIYNVQVSVGQYLPDWRSGTDYKNSVSASKELGGGALLELSHELDYLQWMFGKLALEYCNLRNTKELDVNVEEIADLVLKNEQGILINVHLDFIQKTPHRNCVVIAENARLEWDLINNSIQLADKSGVQQIFSDPEWDKNQIYMSMLKEFIQDIALNRHSRCLVESSLSIVSLIEEIKLSSNL